tara:strand:- start:1237 stop:1770 length:534 start_codon:yes stop_codon:yes gene_type:complete
MNIQSLLTSELKSNQINEILNLKNTHWKYGYVSQKNWFKKNVRKTDLHNILISNGKISGYTFLGFRTYHVIKKNGDSKVLKNYLLFHSLILKSQFRKYKNLSRFMNFNNKIIRSNKKPSFLLCRKDKINMYKRFGWKLLQNEDFEVKDHTHGLIGMSFNFKQILGEESDKYNFYYYI